MNDDNKTDAIEAPLPEDRVAYWTERKTYYPNPRAILLPLLHDLQEHQGHISKHAMVWAADFVGITPVEVYGVATFYWMYDLEPRAKKRIAVCHNIACDLRGKDAILEAIREELGLEDGQKQSADGEWSLVTVECMGSCTTAPMMDINGKYFEELTPDKVKSILQLIREGKEALPEWPDVQPESLKEKLSTSYAEGSAKSGGGK